MIQVGFLLLLCTGAFAQLVGFGACPHVEVVQNFNLTKYLGDWFEVEKYISIPELLEKCITAKYKKNSDGSIKILHRQINILTNKTAETEVWANPVDNIHEAKFYVDFPGQNLAEHFLLDTDYDNYSVVFTCNDIVVANAISVWIWTRQREPPAAVLEEAYQVLDKYNLSRDALMKTDQKNCPNSFLNH